jgi:hypothetical protein
LNITSIAPKNKEKPSKTMNNCSRGMARTAKRRSKTFLFFVQNK